MRRAGHEGAVEGASRGRGRLLPPGPAVARPSQGHPGARSSAAPAPRPYQRERGSRGRPPPPPALHGCRRAQAAAGAEGKARRGRQAGLTLRPPLISDAAARVSHAQGAPQARGPLRTPARAGKPDGEPRPRDPASRCAPRPCGCPRTRRGSSAPRGDRLGRTADPLADPRTAPAALGSGARGGAACDVGAWRATWGRGVRRGAWRAARGVACGEGAWHGRCARATERCVARWGVALRVAGRGAAQGRLRGAGGVLAWGVKAPGTAPSRPGPGMPVPARQTPRWDPTSLQPRGGTAV
ncbi:hypothetical protein VULLAG_LOCUS1508 [Vulpes lagopus]